MHDEGKRGRDNGRRGWPCVCVCVLSAVFIDLGFIRGCMMRVSVGGAGRGRLGLLSAFLEGLMFSKWGFSGCFWPSERTEMAWLSGFISGCDSMGPASPQCCYIVRVLGGEMAQNCVVMTGVINGVCFVGRVEGKWGNLSSLVLASWLC